MGAGLDGIPQGSVLGPLLFVVYINGTDEHIASRILKSADDTEHFSHSTVAQGHCDVAIRCPQTSRMVEGLTDTFQNR